MLLPDSSARLVVALVPSPAPRLRSVVRNLLMRMSDWEAIELTFDRVRHVPQELRDVDDGHETCRSE
jgi:hypothetical protein